MKKYIITTLLLGVFGLHLLAQKQETLTNQSIIELHKAGLSKEVMLAKIQSTACEFDMSTTALINLKKLKLPDEVLNAMMEKDSGNEVEAPKATTVSADAKAGKTTSTNKKSAKPTVPTEKVVEAQSVGAKPTQTPDLEFINVPHFYNKSVKTLAVLERSTVAVKAKIGFGSFVGGTTPIVFKMDSAKSPVRIAEQESLSFMINTGNNVPEIFGLYKMKSAKKKREAIWFNVSAFENKSDKDVIAFNYKKVKDGVYEVVPISKLEKGEYCFVNKVSYTTYGGAKADVFAFGVD